MDFVEQVAQILGTNHSNDIIVDNSLLIVGSGDLVQKFAKTNLNKYTIKITPYIKDYSGSLGDFRVEMSTELVDLSKPSKSQEQYSNFISDKFAQIVFFSAFDENKKPQLGIHFVNDYESEVALCNEIDALIGDFTFEKTILFDEQKCQYFHRDKTEFSYCKDCVAVCPTMAITANDNKQELVFSQIDCILCGKCVAVCPSGAMQKSNATLSNINKALKFYKDKIAVICESKEDFEKFCMTSLTQDSNDFAPLILPSINMLNEVYLLSILQESGRVCVIVCNSNTQIDAHLKECVDFINDLYQRVVGQTAVFTSDFSTNQNNGLDIKSTHLPYYHYNITNEEFIREIFANRIRFLIKDRDYGILKNSTNLIYTDLKIDAEKCTLCNACVESCNTNAIISAKDSFTLLLNPSLCTVCGYCIDTCAEKCLEMNFSGYQLNENFLNYRVLAQDEPFHCVECGNIFATNKSIQKIKGILQPVFSGDAIKLKSLECCEKCKIKIMFEKSSDLVDVK